MQAARAGWDTLNTRHQPARAAVPGFRYGTLGE